MAWDKTEVRRWKAAHMECASVYTDAEIAQVIGVNVPALQAMKKTVQYMDIIASIKAGVIRDQDSELNDVVKEMRQRLKDNLPIAVNTIIQAATQRRDLKLAVSASESLIAMEGNLSPVKRVGLPMQEQGGLGVLSQEDADLASELSQVLRVANSGGTVTLDDPPISGREQ